LATYTTFQELLFTPFNVHGILGFEILSSEKYFCRVRISRENSNLSNVVCHPSRTKNLGTSSRVATSPDLGLAFGAVDVNVDRACTSLLSPLSHLPYIEDGFDVDAAVVLVCRLSVSLSIYISFSLTLSLSFSCSLSLTHTHTDLTRFQHLAQPRC